MFPRPATTSPPSAPRCRVWPAPARRSPRRAAAARNGWATANRSRSLRRPGPDRGNLGTPRTVTRWRSHGIENLRGNSWIKFLGTGKWPGNKELAYLSYHAANQKFPPKQMVLNWAQKQLPKNMNNNKYHRFCPDFQFFGEDHFEPWRDWTDIRPSDLQLRGSNTAAYSTGQKTHTEKTTDERHWFSHGNMEVYPAW